MFKQQEWMEEERELRRMRLKKNYTDDHENELDLQHTHTQIYDDIKMK
jgi:hypothetical protein